MTKKKIWFYTAHIMDEMKIFLIAANEKDDKQIEYSELKSLTKKTHPKVVTNEMNRAFFSFQHKTEGKLFLLEHGVELAKKLENNENQNLELSKALYKNHESFKFVLDCILSFGNKLFKRRQYYNRVQIRSPILNFDYNSNTSKYLNYALGYFLDLDIIDFKIINNLKNYKLKTFEFLKEEDDLIDVEEFENINRIILEKIENMPNIYKLGELVPIPKLRDNILINFRISNKDFERKIYELFNQGKINLHANDQKVEGTIILPTGQEVFYLTKIGD